MKQYHFTSWPDHGVPEYATSMLSFHKRVISQHKTSRGPILVHCRYVDQCVLVQMLWLTLYSAGVGRTGTFICIDNVLEQIKKEKVVDIAGVINKMRHQRMKMVQTHVRLYIRHRRKKRGAGGRGEGATCPPNFTHCLHNELHWSIVTFHICVN